MKERLKAVLRKIMPSLIWQFISFMKHFIFNREAKGLRSINFLKENDDVIVLGNGPSLKNDLEIIAEIADQHDFVFVNNFCSSPYYEIFKPNKYVFLDGYFFSENAHPDWIKQREETFKVINERTTWRMQIFLPMGADKTILEKIIVNPNVEIINVKVHPVFLKKYGKLTRVLFDSGFFGPAQNNVLIYAVYFILFAGYKNLKIFGSDFSIYKNIEVDKFNRLVMKFEHFNGVDRFEVLKTGPMKDRSPNMSNMMFSAFRILKQHEIIRQYADDLGVNIYNLSSYSLIDAYERRW
jgi:hypothetical protein